MTESREPVLTCGDTNTLFVSHLGFTLRTLLAAAASVPVPQGKVPRRTWNISYKGTVIGQVRLKTHIQKEDHA